MIIRYGEARFTNKDIANLNWNNKKLVRAYKFDVKFRKFATIFGIIWLVATGIALLVLLYKDNVTLEIFLAILLGGWFPGDFLFRYGTSSNETSYKWIVKGKVFADVIVSSKWMDVHNKNYKYTYEITSGDYITKLYSNNEELYNTVAVGSSMRIHIDAKES